MRQNKYDMTLGYKDLSLEVIPLDQIIKSPAPSLFQKFDSDGEKLMRILIFEIIVKLVYNELDDVAQSKHIIFVMQPRWMTLGIIGPISIDEETIEERFRYNMELLEEIDHRKD